MLEEATRSMACSISMKPFQRKKYGRNAWLSIVKQHTIYHQWKRQLKTSEDYINKNAWKENASHQLGDRVHKHRNSHAPMVQCSSHTRCQLPNDLTRAMKLIRSVELSDPKLLVAIAKVETDKTLKSDFEGVAAYILLHDHVANDEASSKKTEKCSMLDASVASMAGGRYQKDSHLHFNDFKERNALSVEDKTSLKEWRLFHPDEFGQSK